MPSFEKLSEVFRWARLGERARGVVAAFEHGPERPFSGQDREVKMRAS